MVLSCPIFLVDSARLCALLSRHDRNPREYLGHFWVDSITHDVLLTIYMPI
jgi:hypothetical protein